MDRFRSMRSNLAKVMILIFFIGLLPTNAFAAAATIKKVYDIKGTVYTNVKYSMPQTAQALMSNGKLKNVTVKWEKDHILYTKTGTFKIKGTVKGYKPKVNLIVKVIKDPNAVITPTPTPSIVPTVTVTPTLTPTLTPAPTASPAPTPSPTNIPIPVVEIIPVVTTVAQYEKNLYNALKAFESKIEFTIQGYDGVNYALDKINDLIDKEPTLDYGYSGANASMTFYGDGSTREMVITFKYERSQQEMLKMRSAAEAKAAEVVKQIIRDGMTDLEKEKAIHDYIINNTVYDEKNYKSGTIPEEDYTDYGVLVLGVAVCEGYAKAMYRLLNMVGVECYYVTGYGNGGPHAWNRVKIDGVMYNVDATFDDPIMSDGSNALIYDYFNKSDEEFRKDHSW